MNMDLWVEWIARSGNGASGWTGRSGEAGAFEASTWWKEAHRDPDRTGRMGGVYPNERHGQTRPGGRRADAGQDPDVSSTAAGARPCPRRSDPELPAATADLRRRRGPREAACDRSCRRGVDPHQAVEEARAPTGTQPCRRSRSGPRHSRRARRLRRPAFVAGRSATSGVSWQPVIQTAVSVAAIPHTGRSPTAS